jgi:hypothetical protein
MSTQHVPTGPVPPAVIDKLIGKWESPDLTEANAVTWIG